MWVVRVALQRPYSFVAAPDVERLAIALHTRQQVAVIGLMLALGGGWTAPPEPIAKPGFAPYLAE
jgi:hypothetical protein